MTTDDVIEALGGWEGYWIEEIELPQEKGKTQVWITLTPLTGVARRCSGCGRRVKQIHDVTYRWVRDVSILEAETWLWLGRVRVACPHCGPKVEALDWLAPYSRLTRRMAENVVRLCQVLPIKHVAEYLGLSWDTVKATDKAYLQESLGPVDLSGVEQIVMDEFAIQKGHRYATVIVEPSSKRVLWVGRGRGREDVRPFFEQLGVEGRQRLKAVAMDMNGAYEEEVRYQCPLVQIVFDLFHVVAKYGREVVDRVRVDADAFDERAAGFATQLLHGDLHLGNLLLRDELLHVVDFDDARIGPPVQDLWLLLPGRDAATLELRARMLAAYEELRLFDRRSLALIEPLRGLRLVHYACWLARRWHDPVFPRTWPHFGSDDYWRQETESLEEQLAWIAGERMADAAGHGRRPDAAAAEEELTNRDLFWDWEEPES